MKRHHNALESSPAESVIRPPKKNKNGFFLGGYLASRGSFA